jgi:branched-chain amino acid transport system substrate-binding protein
MAFGNRIGSLMRASLLSLALVELPCFAVAATPDPFEITAILPLTGSGTFFGHSMANGILAAEALANKAGGINGRPIKFVIEDDASNPQNDIQLASDAISRKSTVIVGPAYVSSCNAVAPMVASGPVMYCLSPGVHPAASSYMFSTQPSTNDVIAVSIRYLREHGVTHFAVMTSTDGTGQDADHAIDAAFALPENKTISVTSHEHFNPTDLNVTAQLTRIKASNAQALIAWTTGTPLGTILRDAYQSGLDLPIVTTNGNLTYAQMTAYAQFLPKELLFPGLASVVPEQVTDKETKVAVVKYDSQLSSAGVQPEYMPSTAYDPASIVIAALRAVGTNASPDVLRAYIANMVYTGASGHYDFRTIPQRGLGQSAVMVVRWDKAKTTWVAVSNPGGAPLTK